MAFQREGKKIEAIQKMPSFASAGKNQEFLISVATASAEYFTSSMVCRTSWAGRRFDHVTNVAENLWVAIIASEDQAQTLPLRQAFVRFTPDRKLEAGVMAIIVDPLLPLDAFQHELRAACPDVFRMIAKQRRGKRTAEAWTLTWCAPLMSPELESRDIDEWLSLVTSLKAEKIKCISVSREFETESIGGDKLTADVCETLTRLAELLQTPELEKASKNLTRSGVALVSALSALQRNTLKQADLDSLLVVLRDTFSTHIAFEIVPRGYVSEVSTDVAWIEFDLPGRGNHRPEHLHAGLLLSGEQDQIKLVLEQGHQYTVKKFGGRAAVVKMHDARKRSRAAISRLIKHGFELEQQNLDIADSSFERVQNAQLTALRVFSAAALKDDQAVISALIEMIRVYSDLYDQHAV